jgi:nucleoid-associated protein YgaU
MTQVRVDGRRRTGRILWGRVAVLLLTVACVFLLGRCTSPEGAPRAELGQAQERISELEQENRNLQERVRALEAGGVSGLQAAPEPPPPEESDADPVGGSQDPEPAAPDEAAAEPPAESPPEESTTYTVQPGDNLHAIARQVYGDGAKFRLIAEANDVQPQQLVVGQELVIPPDPDQE